MAFQYTPEPDDKAFRRVDLDHFDPSGTLPEFTDFSADRRPVNCSDQYVLEVMRQDGSITIKGPHEPRKVSYSKDGNCFRLNTEFPVARLWIRQKSHPTVRYKAPARWLKKDSQQYCAFGADPGDLELCGDEYFSACYKLSRY